MAEGSVRVSAQAGRCRLLGLRNGDRSHGQVAIRVLRRGIFCAHSDVRLEGTPGAECVALYNRTPAKGEAFAREFGIPKVYDDPEELLR